MNTNERQMIQSKLDSCSTFIRQENRKPKSERNTREIQRIKGKSEIYKRWLKL